MRHKAQHGEIAVSTHRNPPIITRGDMRQAISFVRHNYAVGHYGPAIDAVLRLIAAAPAELIRQVRVEEGEAQDE
jgi:hypothetical protein